MDVENRVNMARRSSNRMKLAIGLGCFIVLAQVAGFAAIAYTTWNDILSSNSTTLLLPLPVAAQAIGKELIYPVLAPKFAGGSVLLERITAFRIVDPETGRLREIPGDVEFNISNALGAAVVNDQYWWMGNNSVCCTDGKHVQHYSPQRTIGKGVHWPFDYEGKLAVIDTDGAGRNYLLQFVDGQWVEKGKLALPGGNRNWAVDERTGDSVLVPSTSADSGGPFVPPAWTSVFSSNGIYHVFQCCKGSEICYRRGFDFIVPAETEGAVSALNAANVPADTTGWVLLGAETAAKFKLEDLAEFKDELYTIHEDQIWRMPLSQRISTKSEFTAVAPFKVDRDGLAILAPSPHEDVLYIVSATELFDANIYRLHEGQLQRMPCQLDGIFESFKHWLLTIIGQGLAVLTTATVALVLISAWVNRGSTYSFGHDTVTLAPIVRRSLARFTDLALILGPLAILLTRRTWQMDGFQFLELVERFNLEAIVNASFLGLTWAGLVWISLVMSTARWGVTPGKWLFGVRVIRKTLRPCGIPSALLRELLLFIDAPHLLTALPGLLCYLATENGQRIGDLAAGTLVIDARTASSAV